MKIKILCVGKIKENYLVEGIRDFTGRIGKRHEIEIIELPDEKTPQGASLIVEDKIRGIEGERILSRIEPSDYIFALCIEGEQKTTKEFQKRLAGLEREGKKCLVFVIGGSLGLSPEVTGRAKEKISFSAMTFPHQLMRLILLEQLEKALS